MDQTVAELPVMDRAWTWFQVNKKQILWVVGGILVVAGVIAFIQWKKHATENAASAALSTLEAQRVLPGGNRTESADAYLKVANEHAGTKAAARALLLAGGAYFVQGSYAEAQTQFQRFLAQYADSPLRGQAALGVAACLDALGKPEEAVAAYKSVTERHATEGVVPPAKFALARLYESQNKLEEAVRLYEELARGESSGSIANEAGLKAEEIRAKLPAPTLSAIPPATTTLVTAPTSSPAVTTNR